MNSSNVLLIGVGPHVERYELYFALKTDYTVNKSNVLFGAESNVRYKYLVICEPYFLEPRHFYKLLDYNFEKLIVEKIAAKDKAIYTELDHLYNENWIPFHSRLFDENYLDIKDGSIITWPYSEKSGIYFIDHCLPNIIDLLIANKVLNLETPFETNFTDCSVTFKSADKKVFVKLVEDDHFDNKVCVNEKEIMWPNFINTMDSFINQINDIKVVDKLKKIEILENSIVAKGR